jgi:hypothetical protein
MSQEIKMWKFASCRGYHYRYVIRQTENLWRGSLGWDQNDAMVNFTTSSEVEKHKLTEWLDMNMKQGDLKKEDIPKDLYLKLYGKPNHTDIIIRCQCGAEKCKTTHSTWCPKFTGEPKW